jgi:hypothetical protein
VGVRQFAGHRSGRESRPTSISELSKGWFSPPLSLHPRAASRSFRRNESHMHIDAAAAGMHDLDGFGVSHCPSSPRTGSERRGRPSRISYTCSPSGRRQTGVPASTRVRLRCGHRAPLSPDLRALGPPLVPYAISPFHGRVWRRPRGAIEDCGRMAHHGQCGARNSRPQSGWSAIQPQLEAAPLQSSQVVSHKPAGVRRHALYNVVGGACGERTGATRTG